MHAFRRMMATAVLEGLIIQAFTGSGPLLDDEIVQQSPLPVEWASQITQEHPPSTTQAYEAGVGDETSHGHTQAPPQGGGGDEQTHASQITQEQPAPSTQADEAIVRDVDPPIEAPTGVPIAYRRSKRHRRALGCGT